MEAKSYKLNDILLPIVIFSFFMIYTWAKYASTPSDQSSVSSSTATESGINNERGMMVE